MRSPSCGVLHAESFMRSPSCGVLHDAESFSSHAMRRVLISYNARSPSCGVLPSHTMRGVLHAEFFMQSLFHLIQCVESFMQSPSYGVLHIHDVESFSSHTICGVLHAESFSCRVKFCQISSVKNHQKSPPVRPKKS